MVSNHLKFLEKSPEFVQSFLEVPDVSKLMTQAEKEQATVKSAKEKKASK